MTFTPVEIELPTNFIIAMIKACANFSDRRLYLQGIRLYADDKSCKIVATNGKIGVMAKIGDRIENESDYYDVFFNVESLKTLKTSKENVVITITAPDSAEMCTSAGVSLSNDINSDHTRVLKSSLARVFSVVDSIIDNAKVRPFNPTDLVTINTIFNAYSGYKSKEVSIVLDQSESESIVAHSTHTNDIFAVIMPFVRVEKKDGIVDWL